MTASEEPQYRYNILLGNGNGPLLKKLTKEEVIARCLTGEIRSTARGERVKSGAWFPAAPNFETILNFPEFKDHLDASSHHLHASPPVGQPAIRAMSEIALLQQLVAINQKQLYWTRVIGVIVLGAWIATQLYSCSLHP